MRTLTITLTANQVQPFSIAGEFFEIIKASNDIRIDWQGDDGQFLDPWIDVREGVYARFRYSSFTIKNGPAAQTIKVFIGRGEGGNRAAPVSGTVSISGTATVKETVIERGEFGRTYRYAYKQSVPVGQNFVVGIYNPTGSGVNATLTQLFADWDAVVKSCRMEVIKAHSYTAVPAGEVIRTMGAGTATASNNAKCRAAAFMNQSALFPFTGGLGQIIDRGRVSDRLEPLEMAGLVLAPGEAVLCDITNLTAGAVDMAIALEWFER